jgi:hypothetical protein
MTDSASPGNRRSPSSVDLADLLVEHVCEVARQSRTGVGEEDPGVPAVVQAHDGEPLVLLLDEEDDRVTRRLNGGLSHDVGDVIDTGDLDEVGLGPDPSGVAAREGHGEVRHAFILSKRRRLFDRALESGTESEA